MIKQVWQTEDGSIFDDEDEAKKYVAEGEAIEALTSEMHERCYLSEEDIREVITALLVEYIVVRK